MKLRPKDYYEFGQYLLARAKFKSFEAMVNAAMKICEGFKALHLSGLSYQDLNDGNFFIHPETGDVLICDNDNVAPEGVTSGILGKARYMAPEVVTGKTMPNKYTDRYSLSVVLFLLFYANHPLEGARVKRNSTAVSLSLFTIKIIQRTDLFVVYTIMYCADGMLFLLYLEILLYRSLALFVCMIKTKGNSKDSGKILSSNFVICL